jgi:hypothetical protein
MDHWMPGDEWSIDEVYDELDAQRIALGMQPLKEAKTDESKTKDTSEYTEKELGLYNRSIYVSVDLGKKADFSALVFIEPFIPKDSDKEQFTYHISKIKRYDLETPYPRIARTLQKIDEQLTASEDFEYIHYVFDEGGVGAAVTDQVCELIPNADVYRITLSGGTLPNWRTGRNIILPKPQMVSVLIALLESDRILIPSGAFQANILKEELLNYEHKISKVGYDQFGSIKTGQHDDIVSAIGMGVWLANDVGGVGDVFW